MQIKFRFRFGHIGISAWPCCIFLPNFEQISSMLCTPKTDNVKCTVMPQWQMVKNNCTSISEKSLSTASTEINGTQPLNHAVQNYYATESNTSCPLFYQYDVEMIRLTAIITSQVPNISDCLQSGWQFGLVVTRWLRST